jgi:hypothetical protein
LSFIFIVFYSLSYYCFFFFPSPSVSLFIPMLLS